MTARTVFSLVIGASLIASAALAGAQGGPPPGARMGGPGGPGGPGGGRAAMMQKQKEMMQAEWTKLKLTGAQRKKIDAYMAHRQRAMEAWRKANPKAERGAMRPVMEKMNAERTSFLKKVLTGRQFKDYDADMKVMRAQRGGGRRGGPGGPGGPGGRPGGPPPAAKN